MCKLENIIREEEDGTRGPFIRLRKQVERAKSKVRLLETQKRGIVEERMSTYRKPERI